MRQMVHTAEPPPAQFHLEKGNALPEGPAFVSARESRTGSDAYTFFILAEPLTDTAVAFLPTVLDDLVRQLLHRPSTITKALTQALAGVHERLLRIHPGGPTPELPAFGMAIAAVRPGELYLALTGPTLAVLRNGRKLDVLSALGTRDFRRGALGDTREPVSRVFRRILGPGEPVLLAHSPLRRAAAFDALDAAFDGLPEELLGEVYRQLAGAPRFSAVVLTGPALTPPPNGVGERRGNQTHATPTTRPMSPPIPAEFQAAPAPAEVLRSEPALSVADRLRTAWAPLDRDTQAALWQRFRRFRPLRLELRAPRRQHSRRTRPISIPTGAVLGFLAVVLAGVLAAGVWYSGAQNSAGRDARATALIEEATALYDRALAAPTRDQTRDQLTQARRLLSEADDLQHENEQIAPLLATITDSLTQLDAAAVLPEPASVIDLRLAAGNAIALRSLATGANAVLAVERSTNRVFRIDLPADDLRAVNPPVLGDNKVRTPADLRRLVWLPRGGLWTRDSVLALDGASGLWEYRGWPPPPPPSALPPGTTPPRPVADGWVQVPLRGVTELGPIESAVGFAGNLYLLDPAASQIWRYVATDAGFDSERQGVLVAGTDIREAVDFTVDGDVYVVTRGGKVLKFSGGRPQPFPMDGLDKPLLGPTAIMTGADQQGVYVADAGNKRIVVFDKSGRMLRQIILSERLPAVVGVIADEARKTLYLMTDRQVVAAALPE